MAVQLAAGAPPRQKRGLWWRIKRHKISYLFIAPGLIQFAIFTLIPVVWSLYMSFHDWDFLRANRPFVGLDNYIRLARDERFGRALLNTSYFVALAVPGQVFGGMFLALLLNMNLRGRSFWRVAYYLPVVTPIVVVATIWKWAYNGDFGLINYYLMRIGLVDEPLRWLTDKWLAMPAVIIMSIWKGMGGYMILYLAGLQAIPEEYYDAAKVDGASGTQRFRFITLPMLGPITFFCFITGIYGAFQVFTEIDIMTRGGPVDSTTTIVYYLYQSAFRKFEMGYASAMAYGIFAILFVFTLLQMRWFYKEIED